jgi:hypothetical protein
VLLVQQSLAQTRALVGSGIRHHPGPDQSKAPVDADVVLVAEAGDGDVNRPGFAGGRFI